MSAEYWINAQPENETVEQEMLRTIKACHAIHLWTLEKVKILQDVRRSSDLSQLLTRELDEHRFTKYKNVPRYPLERTVEKTLALWFRREEDTRLEPLPEEEFHQFRLPTRKIWKKYVENYSRLSTVFGSLFLEGGWEATLSSQAADIGTTKEFIPAICHSLEVKWLNPGWQIAFNLHNPRSSLTKRRVDRSRYHRRRAKA